MSVRFDRWVLRTTDVDAARAFYGTLFGDAGEVAPLPAEALARGARPHWLGHLGVGDVEATAEAFLARGATRLGAVRAEARGRVVTLRDPGGAVVALHPRVPMPLRNDVVLCALNTPDLARTSEAYCALFGWQRQASIALGEHGTLHTFSYESGGARVGSFADTAGRPGVHPHWLFHFRVPSLATAIAYVREAGGLVLDPIALPDGGRVAVCDDPQGAAFALRE